MAAGLRGGVRPLRDGHGGEVELALPGFVQEPLGPHRDIHEVRVISDGIAVPRPAAVELHRADARGRCDRSSRETPRRDGPDPW